jgi:hypothetical protein
VRDFGGLPLTPYVFSFVTENRAVQSRSRTFEFDGDLPFLVDSTTAEVDSARSPSRVQGFLLFAGDRDNGPSGTILQPSGPDASRGPLGCAIARVQANDGVADDFDPTTSVAFDTGATLNTCVNATDGSTAVIYEFRSFHVRSGVTVRVTGRNAAIFLVAGDVRIEAGAVLRARGDGAGGSPQGAGGNGVTNSSADVAGGVGAAGGGSGGRAFDSTLVGFGENGTAGVGSPSAFLAPGRGGAANPVRVGPGRGAGSESSLGNAPDNRTSPSGGGGGHAQRPTFDGAGKALGAGSSPHSIDFPADPDGNGGRAGATYGDARMPTAEAGSGGGGAGAEVFTSATFVTGGTGGGGGAGGGFVDFTASGTIQILGEIDASGSRGGAGSSGFYTGTGGGGGGSGGGIRLLTPGSIELGTTTRLNAGGGAGGTSGLALLTSTAVPNPGGPGGDGRVVLEDGDSIVGALASANVTPREGEPGFNRGVFDPSRFRGGGLRPVAWTDVVDMGPANPTYLPAVQTTGVQEDFVAGVPARASRGVGRAAILIEARGYREKPDGSVDVAGVSGWTNVGYFVDSGTEILPTWVGLARPPSSDVPLAELPPGSTTTPFTTLSGRPFLQFRFSFFLGGTIGPSDPGPWIDRWTLNLQYDQ